MIASKYQKGIASILVIAILALAGTGGAVVASDNASPGDALYPLDLAAERVRLALAGNTEARAQVQLELAQERLEEAMELAPQKREEHMIQALERYQAHIENAQQNTEAVRAQGRDVNALLERFAQNHLRHQEVLAEVFDRVPERAQDAIRRAVENNERNYQRLIENFPGETEQIQKRDQERIQEVREDLEERGIKPPSPSPSPTRQERSR